jgi:benzoyl-CoA reductase/2-hydroxyglutaryl-CoA dehydratase subunit BcrC/BadD/HgdB
VLRLAEEYRVDGIVNYALRFCAPYSIEATSLERTVRDAGYHFLSIDTDHSPGDVGQLQTRAEAFLEMLA